MCCFLTRRRFFFLPCLVTPRPVSDFARALFNAVPGCITALVWLPPVGAVLVNTYRTDVPTHRTDFARTDVPTYRAEVPRTDILSVRHVLPSVLSRPARAICRYVDMSAQYAVRHFGMMRRYTRYTASVRRPARRTDVVCRSGTMRRQVGASVRFIGTSRRCAVRRCVGTSIHSVSGVGFQF